MRRQRVDPSEKRCQDLMPTADGFGVGVVSWWCGARPGQEFMAQRAGSHTTEIDASHLSMVSQPDDVANLVKDAATATRWLYERDTPDASATVAVLGLAPARGAP